MQKCLCFKCKRGFQGTKEPPELKAKGVGSQNPLGFRSKKIMRYHSIAIVILRISCKKYPQLPVPFGIDRWTRDVLRYTQHSFPEIS